MFRYFRELSGRSGARAAFHNLGWLVAERLSRLLINVLVGLWVARYLGPGEFGRLQVALGIAAVGMAVSEAGVDPVVRRAILQSADLGAQLLQSALLLRLLWGAGCYLLLLLWCFLGPLEPGDRTLLLIAGLLVFQPAFSVADIWLQANLRAKSAVLAQTLCLAVGACARLGLIRGRAGTWAFAAVSSSELLLVGLMMNAFARKAGMGTVRSAGAGLARMSSLFRDAWPLMVSSLAIILYMRIDVVMVRSFEGDVSAGLYAAAVKLSEIWYFVPVAVGSSVLPSLIRGRELGEAAYRRRFAAYFDLSAALAYGGAIPLVLFSSPLVRMAFGPSFSGAAPILAVHAWAALFVFTGVARATFIVNAGDNSLHLIATGSGAVLNILLNLVMIPRFGSIGAAYATLLSQAAVTWLTSFAFAQTRCVAWMQTRALLLPLTFLRYARSANRQL